jgi:hypothetical protein
MANDLQVLAHNTYEYLQNSVVLQVGHQSDAHQRLVSSWARLSGSTMPPSPGVLQYTVDIQYDNEANILSYSLDYKMREITKWLLNKLPKEQAYHRSRSEVIAFSPLRIPEQAKKIKQILEWRNALLDHGVNEATSEELYTMFCEEIQRGFRFDWPYIKRYIKDHKTKSIGGGYKWSATENLSEDQWKDIFQSVKLMWDNITAHPFQGIEVPWNTGMRARPNPITDFSGHAFGEIDRTRIVNFHPSLSIQNIFLPDKKDIVAKILSKTIEIVHAEGEHHFALTEGGQVFEAFARYAESDARYVANDGKNWEASVGLLLGPAFSTLMMKIARLSFLPTGAFFTTILGTMASIIQCRFDTGIKFQHGDDESTYNSVDKRYPWVEEDKMDTKFVLFLGTAFGFDPRRPRICGIKLMSDRADKMIPMPIDSIEHSWQSPLIASKATPEEVSAWSGLFVGLYGSGTLLEALAKLKLEEREFISPSMVYGGLIEEARSDVFAWAETEGIKQIMYR